MSTKPSVQDKNFWDLADVDGALARPVTEEDLNMVRAQWPFLELVCWRNPDDEDDANSKMESLTIPVGEQGAPCFIASEESGWTIQYWVGNDELATAMSSSSSEQVYGGVEDAEGGQAGTVAGQAFATALDMISLAQEQGWPGVQIIAGTENMQWAAWAACEAANMPCLGYSPGPEAHAKAERCQSLIESKVAVAGVTQSLAPGMGAGSGSTTDDGASE